MAELSSLTDEALLQCAMEGRQEAWSELVGRYNHLALRFVRGQINDPHTAQDILQNLWTSLVQTVHRERPDHFGAIFWTLLKRRVIDELRRRGRTREIPVLDAPLPGADSDASLLELQTGAAPDPLHQSLRSEEEGILYEALHKLPDHYRLVIVFRQLEGRSNKETADLLVAEGLVTDDGNVEKRVENYYYRGLKELKKQLEALGFTGGGSAA